MAALDGIFLSDGIAANSSAPGMKCLKALVANICTDRIPPVAFRRGIATPFEFPIRWKADITMTRILPISYRMGGEILVNRTVPTQWSGVLLGGRTMPIAWTIPFVDFDRILSIAWNNILTVDRTFSLAWGFSNPWTEQVDGEDDLWIEQIAGESDLWVKQVDGEPDAWS